MPKARKTPDQRLAELQQKKAQLEARIQKEKSALRQAERKRDTRRKVIAGALALEHAGIDEEFGQALSRLIYRYVKRAEDRALFGLPPLERDEKTGQGEKDGTG